MTLANWKAWVLFASAVAWLPLGVVAAAAPEFGQAEIGLCGRPAPPASNSSCGFSLITQGAGPQVALMNHPPALVASLRQGEEVVAAVTVRGIAAPVSIAAEATLLEGKQVEVGLALDEEPPSRQLLQGGTMRLEVVRKAPKPGAMLRLTIAATDGDAAVRWSGIRLTTASQSYDVPIAPAAGNKEQCPPPLLPTMRPPIERALIEWDWRMRDGIGAPRAAVAYATAIERMLRRGDDLIHDLQAAGLPLKDEALQWQALWSEWKKLSATNEPESAQWEVLWRRAHALRRHIALANPLAQVGPLLLVKQAPGCFSHQLTQYYGRYARPGGGIFVLDAPGKSMQCRQLAAGALPEGSYQHPEVSFDGARVLFAFCRAEAAPQNTIAGHHGRYYHLYEMGADGSGLRQLTYGPFNDFAPRYLPDGRIVFVSTRRQGWHRCGAPGCETYTLAVADADGSHARPLSWHETHEWDPAVLDDGRIIYTRWDYVDRHAVYYEQLWSVRPDGSAPAAFYGNNTFNPVGIWEARGVPGSRQVMATAAAHHAMTAGSIILVDAGKGVDGPRPITRLTPDVPFPESESLLLPHWRAMAPPDAPPEPPEAARWPGHCYRSPYPLSEKYFLAAYSFDALIGEPKANPVNMFGIYLVDCFGNKELLYRDLNIASLWPTPLRARHRPPVVPSVAESTGRQEGTFFLQNVYEGWPAMPKVSVKRLRIVQVLPKSTPGANNPPVGVPNASPGKQVLGTVPVEPDGSACFRAPANIPLSFQALDERGQAVQMMRSITYLQPGETSSCIGCHEPRTSAPPQRRLAQALAREPSTIRPGPDGSHPLSYPILVQPVLDRHCVSCHNPGKPEGGVVLTGEPQGHYTVSYNALAPRVRHAAWGVPGDFRQTNSEPITTPGHFGASSSPLMKLLRDGHQDVHLSGDDLERFTTWMDANVLFYGTFDPADQARQKRGERIAGPKLQ